MRRNCTSLVVAALAGITTGGAALAATGITTARSLGEVNVVRLQAEDCASGISRALDSHGFTVAPVNEKSEVDAVLQVSVNRLPRPQKTLFGKGEEVSYAATLRGARNKLLFSTSGSEESFNMKELCEDVGENIADRLAERQEK
jgi:hypothetical protein